MNLQGSFYVFIDNKTHVDRWHLWYFYAAVSYVMCNTFQSGLASLFAEGIQ